MATFGLVHGAWQGAWCWELVADELRGRRHHVIGMDLPIDDPAVALDDYARIVAAATADVRGELILVAHSIAGLAVPLVAALRPVHRMVFVNGLIPRPGVAAGDDHAALASAADVTHDDGSTSWSRDAAVSQLFPDAPWGRAARAAARLRPQYWGILAEPSPLKDWPDVETAVVISTSDALLDPSLVREEARARLGVTAVDLPGDHSPQLSQPEVLAEFLARS